MGGAPQQPVEYLKKQLKNSHPLFEKGWIVAEEKRSYLQISYPIQEKHYQYWRSKVSKAAGNANSQFAFLPIDMGYIQNNQPCSKYGYTLVNYPNYPYILSDQIKRRQTENAFFKEKQLYFLLYALVAVKIDAKERSEVVGDIKPQNVFIDSSENIKIALLHSFPYETTNYKKAIDTLSPLKNVLLAPEDMQLASKRQFDNQKNVKSEIFSIGATVLSAGILQDLSVLYDYSKCTFFKKQHEAKTTQWVEQENYSEIFKSIVMNLVNPDPQKRIGIEDLWKFLSKYQSSILSKEPFIVNNPPQSLQLGVSVIRSKIHS